MQLSYCLTSFLNDFDFSKLVVLDFLYNFDRKNSQNQQLVLRINRFVESYLQMVIFFCTILGCNTFLGLKTVLVSPEICLCHLCECGVKNYLFHYQPLSTRKFDHVEGLNTSSMLGFALFKQVAKSMRRHAEI